MKAIIFAGGKGARLMPYTHVMPKPLLPVGEQSVLEIILAQLRHSGITDILIATGYKSTLIEAVIGDGSDHGVDITYFRERDPLGTVGALAEVPPFEDTFIMMNGDVLTEEALYGNLLQAHRDVGRGHDRSQQARADRHRLRRAPPGRRSRGSPADRAARREAALFLAGQHGGLCGRAARQAMVPRGQKTDFPDLIASLLAASETVAAYEHPGYWLDIGRLHHLEEAVQDFENSAGRFLSDTGSHPEVAG